ncbi:hypothetical protein DdX_12336 [Ditylenchus destructor]|uniref:Uncharacterized protein n=1 Tax=Ditylenchus destructor TaxID=166010 RepID=A0AAD4MVJ4_9BILA|nr:hypothetical protein DdX_12336 [Ditylenchus destructor]
MPLIFDRHFKHEDNPDGSSRTECLCVFPTDNRKCKFVAIRNSGWSLRLDQALREHLRKHHHEKFKEYQERLVAEYEWFFNSFDKTNKQVSEVPSNSSN